MLKKLSKQLNGVGWSWNNLNTICWAIGSISGSMMEEHIMRETRLDHEDIEQQKSKTAMVDFGDCNLQKAVHITEVLDIEEIAWAPRYGLKGIIDASVRIKMHSSTGSSSERIMPLEFKTGKRTSGQSAMEHSAQVILYTILMSERYSKKDIDSGLLYYLYTDQTHGIEVRSDLVGLVMRQNELATDILKASSLQKFPPMLKSCAKGAAILALV